jgi:hypothetical protein
MLDESMSYPVAASTLGTDSRAQPTWVNELESEGGTRGVLR